MKQESALLLLVALILTAAFWLVLSRENPRRCALINDREARECSCAWWHWRDWHEKQHRIKP